MHEERRRYILENLDKKGYLLVKDIRKALGASAMTIQRDLVKLEAEGLIIRGFGEIYQAKGQKIRRFMTQNDEDSQDICPEILHLAKGLIHDGDSVYFGNGALVGALAETLREKEILAMCSCVKTAMQLYGGKGTVCLTGGTLREESGVLVGEFARDTLANIYLDKALISCPALNVHGALCEYSQEETAIKKVAIRHSKHIILLIKEEKLGMNKLYRFGDLDDVDVIVTDKKPSARFLSLCEERNTKILYPQEGPQKDAMPEFY